MAESWMLSFRVQGEPKAQPRPRAVARGGFARVYNPGTADAWKAAVAEAGRSACPKHPFDDALAVRLLFYMPRPQRLLRPRDPMGLLPFASKPDLDNLAKATLDAMTDAGWWRDDCQIVDLHCLKLYARKEGVPGATIEVMPFDLLHAENA